MPAKIHIVIPIGGGGGGLFWPSKIVSLSSIALLNRDGWRKTFGLTLSYLRIVVGEQRLPIFVAVRHVIGFTDNSCFLSQFKCEDMAQFSVCHLWLA